MLRGNNGGWLLLGGAALLFIMGTKALGYAVKPGATMPNTPEMNYALQVLMRVWAKYGRMATVTSGTDSHDSGFHPLGLALDFRTKDIPNRSDKLAMIAEVKAILGRDYDVIFESEGLDNEHLHIEYDPR